MPAFFHDAAIGDVIIDRNTNTFSPNPPAPVITEEVYAAFKEIVTGTGLLRTIFDAIPRVANKDTPALAFAKWPDKYGTTSKPWGSPGDSATGARPEALEGEEWRDMIRAIAASRQRGLMDQAEQAVTILSALDAAMGHVHRTGIVTVPSGATSFTVETSTELNTNSMPHFVWLYDSAGKNYPAVKAVQLTGTTFTAYFTTALIGGDHSLSWSLVLRRP